RQERVERRALELGLVVEDRVQGQRARADIDAPVELRVDALQVNAASVHVSRERVTELTILVARHVLTELSVRSRDRISRYQRVERCIEALLQRRRYGLGPDDILDVDVIEVDREAQTRQRPTGDRRLDNQAGCPGVRRLWYQIGIPDQRGEGESERGWALNTAVVLGRGTGVASLIHERTANRLNVGAIRISRVCRPSEGVRQRAGIACHVHTEGLL